jgi:catechol 2,3-dioxygenase-like lactoylglutathione lyase family enzyme
MSQRPVMQVAAVTIGAPDPQALAAFYERMLGWVLVTDEGPEPGDPPQAGFAQLRPPPGETGPTLNFEFERHHVPPVWPTVAGEQHITEHLDIAVEDLNETVAWAVTAGATLADHQPQEDVRVMLDPAGHPFCLFLR